MKKLLALVLAAVMALSIVPIALADDVPTLSICSADNTFGLSTDPDLQQAVVSMLEEKCGVKLEAIIPPIGSYNEKLETMMAGDGLTGGSFTQQAGGQGAVRPGN